MAKKKFFKKDKAVPKPEQLEKEGAFVEDKNSENEMTPEELLEYNSKKEELFKNAFGGSRFNDITKRTEKFINKNGGSFEKSSSYFNEDYLEMRISEIIKRELPKLLIEYLEENK